MRQAFLFIGANKENTEKLYSITKTPGSETLKKLLESSSLVYVQNTRLGNKYTLVTADALDKCNNSIASWLARFELNNTAINGNAIVLKSTMLQEGTAELEWLSETEAADIQHWIEENLNKIGNVQFMMG